MQAATRFAMLCAVSFLLAGSCFGQVTGLVSGKAPAALASYGNRAPVRVSSLPGGYSANALTFDAATGILISGGFGKASVTANVHANALPGNDDHFHVGDRRDNVSTI